jgi:hypothetical protein
VAAVQDVEAAVGECQRARQAASARGQLPGRADFRFEAGSCVVHGMHRGKHRTILEPMGIFSQNFRPNRDQRVFIV